MKFAAALLFVLLAAAGFGAFLLLAPHAPPGEVFVELPAGTGSKAMAARLADAGVLRSRYGFLLLRAWKGGTLKAGEYRFTDPASTRAVYARILRGDVYTRAVTVPEGYNLYDIAAAVEAAGAGSAAAFLQAAHKNTDLIAAWAPHATSLEGYLYPDTYYVSRHATPRFIQEAMVRRFRTATAALGVSGDVQRVITVASLVEKEVRFDDERGMAAGVFENRVKAGMPLQTDPTVIYAALLAGRWSGTIHQSDLQRDSPYNTYRHTGLPPGPICSPGAAAIRAVLHPTPTDNLYFVADAVGHTKFSADLKHHAEQVTSYRKSLQ